MHIHGSPWEYGWANFRRAVWRGWKAGCAVMGIAEHAPRMNHLLPWRSLYFCEFNRYFDILEEIKIEFHGAAEVLAGLEIDYHPGMVDDYRGLLPRLPLDFVIGSVHLVKDWVVDQPDSLAGSSLAGLEAEGLYREYFEAFSQAVESRLFDFMAHPDFVKKALPSLRADKPANRGRLYRQAAEALAACEVGIEVNTRGLILSDVGEYYPEPDFLRECARAGVKLTIGSDDHTAERVGDGFEAAVDYAYQQGYRELYFWRNRQPVKWVIG